jgi:prevent-host-death family protein
MENVSIRDLRNHGGAVIDRVTAGEAVTITRGGKPVAELRPLRAKAVRREVLLARWRGLPSIDYRKFREDIDRVLDTRL